jgi:Dolichyl-phosphate-mannose-protein mannosyltransferase
VPLDRKPEARNRSRDWLTVFSIVAGLSVLSLAALAFCLSQGYVLYYGDAQAHLNIARRIVDSRTPGYEQIGTVWLPLPHLLTLPLVQNFGWWLTGLAGALPSMLAFVLSGIFIYLAARRYFASLEAAVLALVVFALNPNLLYLQSTPMTEPLQMLGVTGLFYGLVSYRASGHAGWILLAGAAALASTLTRYEGWFLLPFAALAILARPDRWSRRLAMVALFSLIALAGPVFWLAHNRILYGDALEFYHGPYSAKAIYQRALDAKMEPYPGDHDIFQAVRYYLTAVLLNVEWPAFTLGLLGAVTLVLSRFWMMAFLLLPVVFYVMSMFSSGTPIFLPYLYPHSYYNVRYGLAALPFVAMAAGAVAATFPDYWRRRATICFAMAAVLPWLISGPADWICWKESQVNSEARRKWTAEAAQYLRNNYQLGSGIITSFGDLAGIFPAAGIPFSETLHEGNGPAFHAAVLRPDLFLYEDWAVVQSGDKVQKALAAAAVSGPRYVLVKSIALPHEPVVEIYRRDRARIGLDDSPYDEYAARTQDEDADDYLDDDDPLATP